MPKTAIEPVALSGATMGSVWRVVLDAPPDASARQRLQVDLQAAVDEIDRQMSTWKPDSALMRFNAAPCDAWHPLPAHLLTVLEAGLAISALTGNAFEMNLGDPVRAWGFGAAKIDLAAIRAASAAPRIPAANALEIDRPAGLARKTAPLSLDLSGIAKGYGVDRLAETVLSHGITRALCSIDGEVRALGTRGDGAPWSVGIDNPEAPDRRGGHSLIQLDNAAVATSGDYRHFVTVRGKRLSHTMDPATGAPLLDAPASVTVMALTCTAADAMATALMVLGPERGARFAEAQGMSALFLCRDAATVATGSFAG